MTRQNSGTSPGTPLRTCSRQRTHDPLRTWSRASPVSRTAVPRQIAPSLVFHGGRVITLEPGQPRADAIAILGTRIFAVGATDDVLGLCGPDTQVIDLRGRTVVP